MPTYWCPRGDGRIEVELTETAVMSTIGGAIGVKDAVCTLDDAVELARTFGVTLIGFLRDSRFNVYANDERLVLEVPAP